MVYTSKQSEAGMRKKIVVGVFVVLAWLGACGLQHANGAPISPLTSVLVYLPAVNRAGGR